MTASAAHAAETPHCGETCPVLDFMTVVCNDRMTLEERMEAAIKACTDSGDGNERMTQRAAAKKFNVAQKTLSRRIAAVSQMTHPATPPAPQAISANPGSEATTGKLSSAEARKQLRQLVRDNGGARGLGAGQGISAPQARAWLDHIGVSVPPELDGSRADISDYLTTHTTTTDEITTPQPVHVADPEDFGSGWNAEADDDHPIFADQLDMRALRARVNADIQAFPGLPDDYKRAVQLVTELDNICDDAFFGRNATPWNHDQWAHISSDLHALFSIVGQRAEETANEILRRRAAK